MIDNFAIYLKKFILILILALTFCKAFADTATSGDTPDMPEYDITNHNNSLIDYENFVYGKSVPFDNCFSTGKIMWNSTDANQTYIPGILSLDTKTPIQRQSDILVASGVRAVVYWYSLATVFINPLAALVVGSALFAELMVMFDVCTNTYVIAPHEYINRLKGEKCIVEQGVVKYENANALTAEDVPFFYHCDPLYDPITNTVLEIGNPDHAKIIGHSYGYMGAASPYCTGTHKEYGRIAKDNMLVGKIVVESAGGLIFRKLVGYGICTPDHRSRKIFFGGDKQYVYPAELVAYYKLFDEAGKIRMCVTATTLFPVVAGCGTVAPPGEEDLIDAYLKNYLADTRCMYLIEGRLDLKSLGEALNVSDEAGVSRKSAKRFLMSQFHFTSTVVGCLKDMLIKIFVKVPNSGGTYGQEPYFQVVQKRLKQIVLAVLVLYVCAMGLKIMTSPEPPKQGEAIMMIIKFALVVYFAIGNAFYEVNPTTGEVTGLFPSLISITDELSNMFLEAQTATDPMSFCTYKFQGKNLIGENLYQGNNVVNTYGKNGVKLTVWDLLDCKLINYLNFGTCDYSPGGLVAIWGISALFWVSGIGIIMAIVMFIYCFMLLLVIFKFTHIAILALIVLTILIFLSPIFVPFALFEVTKSIFDKWMQTILGYILYPALLFAFLAIMLATFDNVYYGNLDIKSGMNADGTSINIKTACTGVESIYCAMMAGIVTNSSDACDMSFGRVAKKVLFQENLKYKISYITADREWAAGLFQPLVKLMLFAFLFYLFIGAVSSFLSSLLGLQDIGALSKGGINVANLLGGIGGLIKKAIK